jgi:S1-C subfamily serine protease
LLIALATLLAGGCKYFYPAMPEQLPPLADMEEPLDLFEEPVDEAIREGLSQGVFTGVYVKSASASLDEMTEEDPGIEVSSVIENSPGEAAGLEVGDLLFAAYLNEDPEPATLSWPSDWTALELEAAPGDDLRVVYERAAVEREALIRTVVRVRPRVRQAAERFREEQKVGIVMRTATEVEARAAGLGPGAGAVVVGLARSSPWKQAGLRFEDLIVGIDGRAVAHPQVVLEVIRERDPGDAVSLEVLRSGERVALEARIAQRTSRVSGFTIPLIFSHENEGARSETSLLFGLIGYKQTAAAWEFRLLWIIRFSGGDTDRLEELAPPTAERAGEVRP